MRFDTVLVANRGEIALRVIRACRAEGLRTVAVYSDADREAPHVRAADQAVRIGPPPATQSYLDVDAVLEAARRTGAGAVHPGYGFLSERAAFARAVTEAGLVFIGPPADVIEQMGRKDAAREIAVAAGVPVVPAAIPTEPLDLSAVSAEVGFPLLAKAAAGGGGKGMRIIRSPNELEPAVAAARREAASAFGDDTMLFERYVELGRHIEVQVLADEHGNVVHLFERDCSVQRRHQKVLEECPAPTISSKVRTAVLDAAVALARQVGYVNAGTVEFLVAGDDAYFLEMNTRLQVEHPVTEMVTGRDLVRLQLAIAQGAALPFGQDDVRVTGHAIEARVYAEDPYHGFLPQAGRAVDVRWPARARVDAALEPGQVVTTDYDPMLGKVIAYGAGREAARQTLVAALDETAIVGLTTNVGFLRDLAASPAYQRADIDTAWLDRQPTLEAPARPESAWRLAAWATAATETVGTEGPFGQGDGWRSAGPPAGVPVELADPVSGERRLQTVSPYAGTVADDRGRSEIRPIGTDKEEMPAVELDGLVVRTLTRVEPHAVTVVVDGQPYRFDRPDVFAPDHAGPAGDGRITAPMPGTVLTVDVTAGQRVAAGEVLGVMEAMKMELSLTAPFDGVVTTVAARAGEQVELGASLFAVEPDDETEPGSDTEGDDR